MKNADFLAFQSVLHIQSKGSSVRELLSMAISWGTAKKKRSWLSSCWVDVAITKLMAIFLSHHCQPPWRARRAEVLLLPAT